MEYIGLFVRASIGLIITALVAVAIILINKGVPEIDPIDYDWVLLKDTETGVLAYCRKEDEGEEFVLHHIPELGAWRMYSLRPNSENDVVFHYGELTVEFMDKIELHVQRYSHD